MTTVRVAIVDVVNDTSSTLMVSVSGPSSQSVMVDTGGQSSLTLAPGGYTVTGNPSNQHGP